jgi:hypothetical protein
MISLGLLFLLVISTIAFNPILLSPSSARSSTRRTSSLKSTRRNLIWESLQGRKVELLGMLTSQSIPLATNAQFEMRLSQLIVSNPVSTTTDSNLLDGSWDRVFTSNATRVIQCASLGRNVSPSVYDGRPAAQAGSLFSSSTRNVALESENDDACITTNTHIFGGFISLQTVSYLSSLTRNSLYLIQARKRLRLFGLLPIPLPSRRNGYSDLDILYLDNDLCISRCSEGDYLYVHTKNLDFRRQRTALKVSELLSTPYRALTFPFRIGKKFWRRRGQQEDNEAFKQAQITEDFNLRMGRIKGAQLQGPVEDRINM